MNERIEKEIQRLKKYNKTARGIMARRDEIIGNMYQAIRPTLKDTLTDEEIIKQATELADNALEIQLEEVNRAADEIGKLHSEKVPTEVQILDEPEQSQMRRHL